MSLVSDVHDIADENQTVFDFPVVDATELDLEGSGFRCRVVKNDEPFRFTFEENVPPKNWPRPVTYILQEGYARESVYGPNQAGLFLEHHEFTQSMTPADPDARGFIVVGKWVDGEKIVDQDGQPWPAPENGTMFEEYTEGKKNGSDDDNDCTSSSSSSSSSNGKRIRKAPFDSTPRKLQLLALRIPYGWTIIIDRKCIHGDTTFIGNYCMSMTTDHVQMGSADTVFLKHAKSKKNVMFKCDAHSKIPEEAQKIAKWIKQEEEDEENDDDDDVPESYPVPVNEPFFVYKEPTMGELEKFDRDTKGASFVLQPFSKLSWTTTLFRRFGWFPGELKKS